MKPYRVSEVNKYINKTLSTDFILSDIKIEGEISNFTHHYSGHMYFSLKDEESKLRAVMFKWQNKDLNIELKNGMKIVAKGNISVYEKEGIYQLYIKSIEDSGLGDLYKEFEKLKEKLNKEGLFNEDFKKEIPKLPKKIGVVTSASGAAIKDIINVIHRRFPSTKILIYPALVQGVKAPIEIIRGLEYLDKREDVDLIIFGRGGGAMEELFAFNDENLARTIFQLNTPTISAVGHEIDFTIGDFVADLRAATPSAAAELAVPDILTYQNKLNNYYNSIKLLTLDKLNQVKTQQDFTKRELVYLNPRNNILELIQSNDQLYKDYTNKLLDELKNKRQNLMVMENRLKLVDPELAIKMGYGIITDEKGNIVKSINNMKVDRELYITLKDGKLKSVIKDIERRDTQ